MVLLGQTTYNVVLPAARAGRPWTPGAGIVRRRSPGGQPGAPRGPVLSVPATSPADAAVTEGGQGQG